MTAIASAALTCRACPVQIEGHLDDGRWFYFRARDQAATLSASPVSFPDAVMAGWLRPPRGCAGVAVRRELPELGEFGAGMIGEDEAWAMLGEMLLELPASVSAPAAAQI